MSQAPAPPGGGLQIQDLRSALAGPFTLGLRPGECAAITGPSGSGKSLFLRMLADLDVSEGAVTLDGLSRDAYPADQWRRRVTYVAAEAGWWDDTVKAHFRADQLARAAELAGRLGLEAVLIEAQVARLSTGERQRLALVRALLLDGPVLLLDEPTSALDQGSAALFEALIREILGKGVAVLMVTHDVALGQRLAGAHYQMADRRLSPA
jgi:putative ABC transport system ATP-binding protein